MFRGHEIKNWLEKNPVDNYVILDDDEDMLEEQLNNFVLTRKNTDHEDSVNEWLEKNSCIKILHTLQSYRI